MRQQFAACMREMNVFALAVKQPAAEIGLQGLDGVADGALRQVQFAAGLGEAAAACQADEGAELSGVDGLVHECYSYIH